MLTLRVGHGTQILLEQDTQVQMEQDTQVRVWSMTGVELPAALSLALLPG